MGNVNSIDASVYSSSNEVINNWILPTTEYSLRKLYHYFEQYRLYVKHNPLLVSEIESALYWISYLFSTTRFHNSRIISELLYSCSSLLTLFNDNLLRNSYHLNRKPKSIRTFHTILQFIEYTQVFVEITAIQLYGRYGKWVVVSIIELIKAAIRLLLLLYFQEGLTRRQYLTPLDRSKEFERYQVKKKFPNRNNKISDEISSSSSVDEAIVLNDNEDPHSCDIPKQESVCSSVSELNQVFRLKSSGRFIRNIEHAPPKEKRMWITPVQTFRLKRLLMKNHRSSPTVTQLNRRRLIGEMLHILRPVIHLATGAAVGGIQDRWSPYLVSLGLDLISLRLLQGSNSYRFHLDRDNLLGLINDPRTIKGNNEDFLDNIWNWSEQMEIHRRYLSLFMYLLRSPFYDQYTKQRLIRLLSLFANYIPIFGRLARPFISYLPEWQQVYFYVWNI